MGFIYNMKYEYPRKSAENLFPNILAKAAFCIQSRAPGSGYSVIVAMCQAPGISELVPSFRILVPGAW